MLLFVFDYALMAIHFPVELQLGNAALPLHFVMETGGIFIGFRYFLWLKKKQGDPVESSNRVWILIAATFGALLGSRLVGALENPTALMAAPKWWVYAYQQKTVVGGLLGGLFLVELVKVLLKEKTSSGDLFVYPFILAMIIGRVGCFSMGVYEETYGLSSQLPWAMNLGDGLLRHPVALYEIVFLVLLWAGLRSFEKKRAIANGARFKVFMLAYLAFRFSIDFIKPHYTWGIGLSSIQIACVVGWLWYLPYLANIKRLYKTPG